MESAVLSVEVSSPKKWFSRSYLRRNIEASVNLLDFQGRGFNVQIHYVEEPVPDYLRAAVSTVLLIHEKVNDIWMMLGFPCITNDQTYVRFSILLFIENLHVYMQIFSFLPVIQNLTDFVL